MELSNNYSSNALLDPTIEVRDLEGQVDDFYGEIKMRVARNQRVLVTTTLTKKEVRASGQL